METVIKAVTFAKKLLLCFRFINLLWLEPLGHRTSVFIDFSCFTGTRIEHRR